MTPKSTPRGQPTESQHRGRPIGSIKLAAEAEANILTYIEAGAADYIAAEIAGIDSRTFRDYVQRGLGLHPTRACTPRLARFAKAVMQAKARARAAREIEAADHHVIFWLTHMARSKPGREGWTDPVESDEDGPTPPLYQPPSPWLVGLHIPAPRDPLAISRPFAYRCKEKRTIPVAPAGILYRGVV